MKKEFKVFLNKEYKKFGLYYLISIIILILGLKINGTGYRGSVLGNGSGPLRWDEIFEDYFLQILITSIIPTFFIVYFSYYDYMNKDKTNKEN